MATHTVYLTQPTGGTYYAYPVGQSLASWATYRVQLAEAVAPNLGRYSGSLDDANGTTWQVFSGASQPASWDLSLATYDLTGNRTYAQTLAAALRSALGLASANLDTQLDAIEGAAGGTVSADIISPSRTWVATGYRANNIIEVAAGFTGTLSVKPDLNTATTINAVTAVTITGAATVTATDLAVDRSRLQAHFTVPALSTVGTYTVAVTVTTVDGQTIKTTGTLKVY